MIRYHIVVNRFYEPDLDIDAMEVVSLRASGTCVKVNKAKGRVWVFPGILDTNVMVAPNSPKLLANARMMPVMIPGSIRGRVMVKNTRNGPAPRVRAASSKP